MTATQSELPAASRASSWAVVQLLAVFAWVLWMTIPWGISSDAAVVAEVFLPPVVFGGLLVGALVARWRSRRAWGLLDIVAFSAVVVATALHGFSILIVMSFPSSY